MKQIDTLRSFCLCLHLENLSIYIYSVVEMCEQAINLWTFTQFIANSKKLEFLQMSRNLI